MEQMINYILGKYPNGIMNGRKVVDMSKAQICAIYNNLIARDTLKKKPANVPGQMSLFD